MDNPTKVLNKPMAPVDPNKTKIEGAKPKGPGTSNSVIASLNKPKTHHSKPGASAMSPEQKQVEMGKVTAEAQKNLLLHNQDKSFMPGGMSHNNAMVKPSASSTMQTNNKAKQFSIMDRLRTAGGSFMDTVSKMGKQVQNKVQNAAKMPGVNQKLVKSEDILEMVDLLKGQFSKLGKPGATDAARAGAAQFVQSQGKAAPPRAKKVVAPKAAPAVQPAAAPPHASVTPASQPVAAPVAAKPVAPHVAEAHVAAKSKAHHNKIAQNIAKVKKPAQKPNTLPNPKPQDHAVKSPENAAHFKQQAAAKPAAPQVSQTERTVKPGAAPVAPKRNPNIIPKGDARNQAAVQAQSQTRFESEKTANHEATPDNGWKSSHEEETAEATTREDRPDEKTVRTKYADISNPALYQGKSVHGEAQQRNETNSVPKRSESAATANVRVGQGNAPQSSGANAVQSKPQASVAAPSGQPSAKAPSSNVQASQQNGKRSQQVKAPAQRPAMAAQDVGVKKPFHPEEAHSRLVHFLHQLVKPGGAIPGQTASERGLVQHSRHFMGKSEEQTAKDSLGATSVKIKESAKKQPAAKQAELLTNPDNFPEHNRKKLLTLVRKCGKMP